MNTGSLTRRWGSAKACGWMRFRTGFMPDKHRNRYLEGCRQMNLVGTALRSGGTSATATAQPILVLQSGVMPWHGLSGCGFQLCGLLDRHAKRKGSFLAHQAQLRSHEQQQGKPALHPALLPWAIEQSIRDLGRTYYDPTCRFCRKT